MSEQEFSFANLMDLATVDTSDMSAQTSRLQAEGIYVIDLTQLNFSEQPPQDPADPMNYNLIIKGTILAYSPLEQKEGEKPQDLTGRDLSERYFLFGENLREAIQLIMGRYKTVGFKHKGVMGGVEGQPGWIDEALGKRVAVRVRHYTAKNGQERVSYDWLSPKALEKLGMTWEVMGRDFLDEHGNPVELAA